MALREISPEHVVISAVLIRIAMYAAQSRAALRRYFHGALASQNRYRSANWICRAGLTALILP